MTSISVLNDLRSYSRHWLTEFIEIYRKEECLWQAKHPDYSNYAVRNNAYDKLVEKLKEVEPNPDRAMVVRKINSLRSAFRREFRKTLSKDSYETRLWYFDKLMFIADQNPKRLYSGAPKRELKINFEDDSMEFEPEEDVASGGVGVGKNGQLPLDGNDLLQEVHSTGSQIKTENTLNHTNPITVQSTTMSVSTAQVHQQHQQQQQQQHLHQQTQHQQQPTTAVKVLEITTLDSNSQREIQQAVNSLEQHQQQMQQIQNAQAQQAQVTQIHHQQVPTIQISREHLPTLFNSTTTYENPRQNDEFDAIGINVASKLRAMNPTQRIIAEKLISDVLFNGQLDQLHISTNLAP